MNFHFEHVFFLRDNNCVYSVVSDHSHHKRVPKRHDVNVSECSDV